MFVSRVKPEVKSDSDIKYLHGKGHLPIYTQNDKFLTTQEIMNVLLDSDLKDGLICTEVPFSVHLNAAFIVDLSKFKSTKDVLCDDMGSWNWNGSFKRWCSITSHGMVKQFGRRVSVKDLPTNSYRVWKRYYYLKGSPDVRKMVAFLAGKLHPG